MMGRRLVQQQVELIVQRSKEGRSDGEIAKEVGCARWTVAHYLGRAPGHGFGRPYGSAHPRPPPLPKIARCMNCNDILGEYYLKAGRGNVTLGYKSRRFCSWKCLAEYATRRARLG